MRHPLPVFSRITIGILAVSLPFLAQAAPDFGSAPTIERGVFIRGAMQALSISAPQRSAYSVPYARVPNALLPYIQKAHERNALGAFGANLYLAQPITRGQALRFVVEVMDKQGSGDVQFRVVRSGSMEESAVQVAIEEGWMDPLSNTYFGLNRLLSAEHAREFLQRVLGEAPSEALQTEQTPAVQVYLRPTRTQESVAIPNASLLNTVWQVIHTDFLYQEQIDEQEATYSALEAIVESLDDPYSRFMRPASARNFQTQIDGQLSGIGAQVEMQGDFLTIVTPLTGSPAEKAGLKPNDRILTVDGQSIVGMDLLEAVEKIRGPKGSQVQLTVERNGSSFTVTVVRDEVRVPEIAISWQGDVAIVKLMQFGRLTDTELRGFMVRVQEQDPSGIVLDLRNNPGGLLHAANIVLSNFVPKGSTVAIIRSRGNEHKDTTEDAPTIHAGVPVVVLVNTGSASASEIVAAALQEYGRARVVGEQTFGKGTVQEVLEFTDGSGIKLTIAEWFTPKGNKIDGSGVNPDTVVRYESDRDVQLLKALELLRY